MAPKPHINLMRGWPNPSLLPVSLLKSAASAVLTDPNIFVPGLEYGDDEGYEPLRQSIAAWLSDFYRPRNIISSDRICITGGASQNLGCMLNVYTDPEYTRNIWIVAPAYYLSFDIFEDAGFGVGQKMRAVPEDEQGLDIGFLRREMEKSETDASGRGVPDRPLYKPQRARAKVYKHIIYCVPTFSNPSSRTMSLDRRKALVRLARQYDALIVCDDVYDFLQWPAGSRAHSTTLQRGYEGLTTAHLPRIVDLDREYDGGAERDGADGFGNACSNGSFSKIAGPGLRVGWIEGTDKFAYGVSQTGTTCSGGAPSQFTSTYINHLFTTGALDNHITSVLRPAYAARYDTLMNAIHTHLLPLGFSLPQTDREVIGGYFTWLRLPSSFPASAKLLAHRCLDEENVKIANGDLFEVPGDHEHEAVQFNRYVRFCWAWEDEWKLEEGIKRVAGVVRRMLEEEVDGTAEFVVVERDGRVVENFK